VQRVLAARLFSEGESLRSEGRLDATMAALERYRQAFDAWTAANDRAGQARSARRLGEVLQTIGRPDEALPHLAVSLRAARVAADTEAECAALTATAMAYLDLGKMNDASDYARQALQLARDMLDGRQEAGALNVLGDVLAFSGHCLESVEHYKEALNLSKELLDRRGQAQALLNLGYAYSDLSRLSEAQAAFEASLVLWRTVEDRGGQALALRGLGRLHVILGANQQALGSYGHARVMRRAIHGIVNNNRQKPLGNILSLFDQKGEAQDGYLRPQGSYNRQIARAHSGPRHARRPAARPAFVIRFKSFDGA
jgi:tetratricopeptide (TPR) repeat protein